MMMDREAKRQALQRISEALAFLGYDTERKQRVYLAGIIGASYRAAGEWLALRQCPRDLGKLLAALQRRGIPGHWLLSDGSIPLGRAVAVTGEERQFLQDLKALPATEQQGVHLAIKMMASGVKAQQVLDLVNRMNSGELPRAAGFAEIERLWKFRNLSAV